jgi:hypothetical protein
MSYLIFSPDRTIPSINLIILSKKLNIPLWSWDYPWFVHCIVVVISDLFFEVMATTFYIAWKGLKPYTYEAIVFYGKDIANTGQSFLLPSICSSNISAFSVPWFRMTNHTANLSNLCTSTWCNLQLKKPKKKIDRQITDMFKSSCWPSHQLCVKVDSQIHEHHTLKIKLKCQKKNLTLFLLL